MRFSLNIAQKPLKFHGFHVLKGGAYGQGQLIIDGVKRPVYFVYHGQKHKDRVVIFYTYYDDTKIWFKDQFTVTNSMVTAECAIRHLNVEYPPKSGKPGPRSILAEVPRHGGKSAAEKFAVQCISMHFSRYR